MLSASILCSFSVNICINLSYYSDKVWVYYITTRRKRKAGFIYNAGLVQLRFIGGNIIPLDTVIIAC